jgi:hypothetical protein
MRKRNLTLVLLVALVSCAPGTPPPPSQYRTTAMATQVPVLFAPGTARVAEPDRARLGAMRWVLPAQAVATLQASGPFAVPRGEVVAQLLDRPVQLVAAEPGMPVDQTLLLISNPAIVADACRGPGERGLGSIWPSNDDVPPRYLPPGCATAAALQAQIVEPDDLLTGRPLPPGAATPFAAAIERYYHRSDAAQSSAGQSEGQAADQSGSSSTATAGAPGLLVGPLPPGGQGGPPPSGEQAPTH